MTSDHPHYDIIYGDARYRQVQNIPLGESLEDCQQRVMQVWKDLVQDISKASQEESNYSLVVAHANTLRALVMHLDEIPKGEIEGLNIPTAIPFYYDIDKTTGAVISSSNDNTTTINNDRMRDSDRIGLGNFRGIYISDERKKRSFLERRRAANDPWLWALHDHQVAREMLLGDDDGSSMEFPSEGLVGLEEEAKKNTQLFSSALKGEKKR
jgi:2,3-bisphosphoglycerate-dependent phosphoglycerate mutase